jgi:hypothetical protein
LPGIRPVPEALYRAIVAVLCVQARAGSRRNPLDTATKAVAIDADGYVSFSDYPEGENSNLALVGDPNTKCMNFAGMGTGIIIPETVPTVFQSIQILTANDAPERNPFSFKIYCTDDPIASQSNSDGNGEASTLIGSGGLDIPTTRFATAVVAVGSGEAYASYKTVLPTLRNVDGANSMQFADLQLRTTRTGLP